MGFYHATDARIAPPDDRPVTSIYFAGYPPEVIADWCCVSIETARRWKFCQAEPSTQAKRLFELHRERQILGHEWRGWIVKGNRLVDPEGHETTQGQLRAYYQVYQLCRELMRDDADALARFADILANAG